MKKLIVRSAPTVLLAGVALFGLSGSLRAQKDAAKMFSANCTLCHAADGSGSSPSGKALGAKDLRSAEIQKKTDQELTELITTGKGKMPAFGKKLQPDDIKQLVAYIRSLAKAK